MQNPHTGTLNALFLEAQLLIYTETHSRESLVVGTELQGVSTNPG